MGKQMTEMLKGTLEGIVLALLGEQPAYGYDITARLRDHGFTDIAEGTIYALLVRIEQKSLVDVEKVPSEKGPPRKVYTLNAQGRPLGCSRRRDRRAVLGALPRRLGRRVRRHLRALGYTDRRQAARGHLGHALLAPPGDLRGARRAVRLGRQGRDAHPRRR